MSVSLHRSANFYADLAGIIDYFREENVDVGIRFMDAVELTIESLCGSPGLGSPFESENPRLKNLLCWPVKGFENYLIFFRRVRGSINLMRIVHGSRDLENNL